MVNISTELLSFSVCLLDLRLFNRNDLASVLLSMILDAVCINVDNLRLSKFLLVEVFEEEVVHDGGNHLHFDGAHEALHGVFSVHIYSHGSISLCGLVSVVREELVCGKGSQSVVHEDHFQRAEQTLEVLGGAFGVIRHELVTEGAQNSSQSETNNVHSATNEHRVRLTVDGSHICIQVADQSVNYIHVRARDQK